MWGLAVFGVLFNGREIPRLSGRVDSLEADVRSI